MKSSFFKKTIIICLIIYVILFALRSIEILVLRLDESVFNENFIHKTIGVVALIFFIILLPNIGFKDKKPIRNILIGLGLGLTAFFISYSIECLNLSIKNGSVSLEFYVTRFSMESKEVEKNTGFGFIILCIVFNIINVVMEEGFFRGVFIRILSKDHSVRFAIIISAVLFGVWHIVSPFRDYLDGEASFLNFLVMGLGYIILSFLMGIKWGMLYKLTGSLYAGMVDHFINNCIATNLLHVISNGEADSLMIVRVLIAQALSLTFISIWYCRKKKKENVIENNQIESE